MFCLIIMSSLPKRRSAIWEGGLILSGNATNLAIFMASVGYPGMFLTNSGICA